MNRIKGILYATLSSTTFGLAPFFTLALLFAGYSPFEALSYRWGIATIFLVLIGMLRGVNFRLGRKNLLTVFFLSLFRATTSFSDCIWKYCQRSCIGDSCYVSSAIFISLVGAVFLSLGDVASVKQGNVVLGTASACVSIFSYAGYIVGVQKTRAAAIPSIVLTCYVMGIGAVMFIIGGLCTGGVRIETDAHMWLYIVGLALVATAISNISLVQGIKYAGSTLASIMGAMEPLTAVVLGIVAFHESFAWNTGVGIALILFAVLLIAGKQHKAKGKG